MVFEANYEFMFVGRDDNSFLENYYYDLFQDHGEKSGQIFVNLEVQNNPVDAEEIGGVIFETMQKVFFENMDMEPYLRFEVALKAVNNVLSEFKSQKVSGYVGNLNVIIAAIVGNELLLSQSGDAEAYLIRKRYISIVSEGLSDGADESGDVFSSIANGKIESGDFILFSSTRLLRYVGKNDLASCVSKKGVNNSLENVKDIVSTEILGRVGLTGISFKKALKEDIVDIGAAVDRATKSVLESSEDHVSKTTETLTGKFFSIFNKSSRRPRVVKSQRGAFVSAANWCRNFIANLFSKGFGKDKILAVLILVIVVLTVGIFVAKNSQVKRAEIERLEDILEGVQEKLIEAETKASYDKEVAKALLDQAAIDANMVLNSQYYRDKAGIYLTQIEETRDKLDNVERVEDLTVLADLTTKRSDINALGFALVNDRVFVFEYNALYELVLDQIQDPLTIDEEESVIAATGFDDRNSLVFLTKSGKLIEYKDGTMSFMDTDDGAFHKGSKLADWSNKIYLLDSSNSQIWKYTYKGTRNKFGSAEAYVNDDTDLSSVEDFSIDGSVYALENSGDILKFYAGAKQEFYINDAPLNMFQDPTVLYTNEKLDYIYVLDSKESRVLTFLKDSKTGNIVYTSQYLFDDVQDELRDLYVDVDSNKMYILTSTQVLELEL